MRGPSDCAAGGSFLVQKGVIAVRLKAAAVAAMNSRTAADRRARRVASHVAIAAQWSKKSAELPTRVHLGEQLRDRVGADRCEQSCE